MKKFKKTNNELFICEECGKVLRKTMNALSFHLNHYHNMKEYFDKYLKEENEDKCQMCDNKTDFYDIHKGYKKCCSLDCTKKYKLLKTNEAIFNKYGVYNISQSEEIKRIKEKTCIKNHGVKYYLQSEELKEKHKEKLLKETGYDHNFKDPKCVEKRKNTWLKNLGVEWPQQNKNVLEKGQKTAKLLKIFRDTTIWYQGTYELDFLNKYYDKFPDIVRGPSIKYYFEDKNKVYHPDFFIPSLNLIIEIKSSWILARDFDIKAKEKATIANGFNYLMILNKDYSNIEN